MRTSRGGGLGFNPPLPAPSRSPVFPEPGCSGADSTLLSNVGRRLRVDPGFARPTIGLGGDLKHAFCVGQERDAWLSPPEGDLADGLVFRKVGATLASVARTFDCASTVWGVDLHPAYLSRRFLPGEADHVVDVQHHHAHAIACAVDCEIRRPVIAIVCDGTGYGIDSAIWGGEVLVADDSAFRRVAHLEYFPLPGGDAAARETARVAFALWRQAAANTAGILGACPAALVFRAGQDRLLDRQIAAGVNAPACSSLGRLFDGVAGLIGACGCNRTEGEAAMELERLAGSRSAEPYPFEINVVGTGEEPARLDWRPMIRAIVADADRGAEHGEISARFHETMAAMFTAAARAACQETGIDRVVLSGGCFHNRRLRTRLIELLAPHVRIVTGHHRVPTGDAGLAVGQAVIAAAVVDRRRSVPR